MGLVGLDRNILSKSIFRNEKLLKVWIWCLLKASYKEREEMVGLQKIKLRPGQFWTGRFNAAEELHMSPSTAWRLLKFLEKNQSLNINSNNKFSVITLENWEFYQIDKYKLDTKMDTKKTTNGQQVDTNNKVNKENNILSVFNHWNLKSLIKHRKLTEVMKSHINARLVDGYELKTILQAIDNFDEVVNNPEYYWTHKFTLTEFLNQRNLDRFLTENDPFKNFKKNDKTEDGTKIIPFEKSDDQSKVEAFMLGGEVG